MDVMPQVLLLCVYTWNCGMTAHDYIALADSSDLLTTE